MGYGKVMNKKRDLSLWVGLCFCPGNCEPLKFLYMSEGTFPDTMFH